MPLTPETTKNDKTPKKGTTETPKKEVAKALKVSKTHGMSRYTDYMTPEEWAKLNTEKGYIESPVKSTTGSKYPTYYDASKYTYAAAPAEAGGYERWYKKGEEGTLKDYSKETDYFPTEVYGGGFSKPYDVQNRAGGEIWRGTPPKATSPTFTYTAGEGTYKEQENAYKEANSLDENWRPKTATVTVPQGEITPTVPLPNEAPITIPQNKAKGGKVMAPKMKKYAVGGEIAGYNFQGQPLDRYGKVIENEGMSTEDVGKASLDILMNTAGKLGGSKTTTSTGNTNTSSNATSDATNSAQSGSTESGGAMDKLGGKAALIGAATDLGVAGAGLGAAYIDSKNKDARGRYENVESAVGSSALKGAALGAKMGSLVGPMGTLVGAGVGAAGGAIYGGIKGKKDVAAIKTSEAKMKTELAKANTLTNQQRALANRDAGILEGNLATPLTEGEAMYNEKDELINPLGYAKGGVIGAAKMRYAKGGTIVGKGGPKDDAIFTKANKEGIEPGSFIVPAENNEKAKGIRAALFGDKNKVSKFKKGGEMESNVAVSNGEHLFTPKERKKIVNYLGEEILEELAPNAEENSEEMNMGGMLGTMTDRTNMREYKDGGLQGFINNDNGVAKRDKTSVVNSKSIYIPKELYQPNTPEEWGQQIRLVEQQIGRPDNWTMDSYNKIQNKLNEYKNWRENTEKGRAVVDYHNEPNEYVVPLPSHLLDKKANGGLTKSKAKTMLHEGMANGKPITEQQRKYFGWVAGGSKESKMDGGAIHGYEKGGKIMAPKMEKYKDGTSKKGSKKAKDMAFEPMERRDVTLEELRKMDEAQALGLQQAGEKAIMAKPIVDVNAAYPAAPIVQRKGLADYVKNIDPGAAFSAYQIMQGSKLLRQGERPKDVSAIDPAWNAAVERAQREASFGYTPEQAAMLDQKAINALNDARFSGKNLAGGSAGTAFQQERQAINQGWSNALQLKSADQQLRMQKQQYADQAVRERAAFLDSQRRRAFGDAMDTYNINQESGSALVGAGVRGAIGAFRYQKELEAQERAYKRENAPVYKG